MGRKCYVLDCLSDSKRTEDNGVTFHKMPFHSDLRPKWIELCRIPEERQTQKTIYVCSRHFRRTDFCNFKGTKYILRQGALPSVFPWSKPIVKLQQLDETTFLNNENFSETDDDENNKLTESESVDNNIKIETTEQNAEEKEKIVDSNLEIKSETIVKLKTEQMFDESMEIKTDNISSLMGSEEIIIQSGSSGSGSGAMNFTLGAKIETNDFNGKWYTATISEIDYEENEVLVQFDKHLNKANEWIPMDSPRLRPHQEQKAIEKYELGEKCLASWGKMCHKFPATIKRIVDEDVYEVLFDDGVKKVLKSHKLLKLNTSNVIGKPKILHASPLFDPVVGSKQDRRVRKRKLIVSELFGKKRHKHEETVAVEEEEEEEEEEVEEQQQQQEQEQQEDYEKIAPDDGEEWTCRWLNGEPVGVESSLESSDGFRRSVVVPDHRLPSGWVKHLTQRRYGFSAGKWEVIMMNPDGRRFHSRHILKAYLEANKMNYNIERFDYRLHINRARKLGLYEITDPEMIATLTKTGRKRDRTSKPPPTEEIKTEQQNVVEEEDDGVGLKIKMENDSYKCPIEGCGKNFRKENLAQMHIKHYHPEYTKFIGTTPNVADLAYARTVGEPFDDFVPKERLQKLETSTPKQKSAVRSIPPKTPEASSDGKKSASKDSEIIKLLNSEPKLTLDIKSPISNALAGRNNATEPSEHRTGIKTLLPIVKAVDSTPIDVNSGGEDTADIESIINTHSILKTVERQRGRKRRSSENEAAKRKRLQLLKCDTDDMSDYYEGNNSHSYDSFQNNQNANKEVINKINNELVPVIPPAQDSAQIIIEGGEVIKLVHMRSEEIINCTCGITEEDGLMVQCELCLCWQHGHCHNIFKEADVPEKYICYICRNPQRMRLSKKYLHDQDWLKLGVLPTGKNRSKNDELLTHRFGKLKRSHDLSGYLIELNEHMHNIRVKLNIAESKNHPKLYLWAKPWKKIDPNVNVKPEPNEINSSSDHSYIKGSTFGDISLQSMLGTSEAESKTKLLTDTKIGSESELISILETGDNIHINDPDTTKVKQEESESFPKIDLNTMIANSVPTMRSEEETIKEESKEAMLNSITSGLLSSGTLDLTLTQNDLDRLSALAQLGEDVVVEPEPAAISALVPQPEAAIDSFDCQMNLLDHVAYHQDLIEQRLDAIEAELNELDESDGILQSKCEDDPNPDDYSRTKQMLQMLIRDLSTIRQIAALN